MSKIFTYVLLLCAVAIPLRAELTYEGGYNPAQTMAEYENAAYPEYSDSIIYVFYNSQTCYNCPETIKLIEEVYDQNFQSKYEFFIIDYFEDNEYNFMQTYNLGAPVSMVLQRIEDREPGAWRKFDNLQNMTSDPVSFQENIRFQINNFLGE